MENENEILVVWTNVKGYCRMVFWYPIEGDPELKSKLKVLERKGHWEAVNTIYGIEEKEERYLNKENARKLWMKLQEEHGFGVKEDVG